MCHQKNYYDCNRLQCRPVVSGSQFDDDGRPSCVRARAAFGSVTLMNRIYERISNYRFKRGALDRVCGKPIRTADR